VKSVRADYACSIRAWLRTLEGRWEQFAALAGEETARVWRLCLVGGALALEERRMGVDQILAVRPDEHGNSGMTQKPRGPLVAERPATRSHPCAAVSPRRCSRSASWTSSACSGAFQSGPSRCPTRSSRCTTVLTWTCSSSLARARLAPCA
jgi:hypothetical protein